MIHSLKQQSDVALVSAGLALFALLALGHLIYAAVPPTPPELVAQYAQELFVGNLVSPEPQEKMTYFGLLAATPVLLFGIVALVRRSGWRLSPCFHRWVIAAVVVVSVICAIVDMFWLRLIWPLRDNILIWATTISFVLIGLVAPICSRAHLAVALAVRALLIGTIAVGAILTFCWRIFDVRAVSNSPSFTDHYEAVAFSVAQIGNGATCLVDVIPQYGCYGEFMAPVMRLIGVSTFSTTLVFSSFQLIAFLTLTVWARRLIANRVILIATVLLIVIVTNRIWYPTDDQFYQGFPVRLLFPVLSLPVASAWLDRPTPVRAFLMGAFAGLSALWNLDTGSIVVVALAILVLFGRCTAAPWRYTSAFKRLPCLGLFCLGLGFAIGTLIVALRLKGGVWPAVGEYFTFQRIFFVYGFGALPMTPFPSLWSVFAGLAVVALSLVASRLGLGPYDRDVELIAFLAILALGLLSYYIGRSHWQTLALVSWPFIVLAGALADRAWRTVLTGARWTRIFGLVSVAFTLSWSASIVVQALPRVVEITSTNLKYGYGLLPPQNTSRDVEYVRSSVPRGSRVAILAMNGAPLLADTGLKSAIVGMSWAETLRKSDAARQIAQLLDPGVDHLLLSAPLLSFCCKNRFWVRDNLPTLRKKYALTEWGPGGNLAHLVPQASIGNHQDLFQFETAGDADFHALRDAKSGLLLGDGSNQLSFPA